LPGGSTRAVGSVGFLVGLGGEVGKWHRSQRVNPLIVRFFWSSPTKINDKKNNILILKKN
jgi:hypothetical protein